MSKKLKVVLNTVISHSHHNSFILLNTLLGHLYNEQNRFYWYGYLTSFFKNQIIIWVSHILERQFWLTPSVVNEKITSNFHFLPSARKISSNRFSLPCWFWVLAIAPRSVTFHLFLSPQNCFFQTERQVLLCLFVSLPLMGLPLRDCTQ